MLRNIAIVTGSRADYGILRPLMAMVRDDSQTNLRLIVTGMHLNHRFGATVQTIENDGFTIDARVEMPLANDSPADIAASMGFGLNGMTKAIERLTPDLVVLLGDRYEMFCAAQAAMLTKIPIAHIHGGESSEGAMDESIRHAITKLSHLHFTAAEPYRQRVIQMGEHPENVWNVGALGLDTIRSMQWMSLAELGNSISFQLRHPFFLVTYHPVTLARDNPAIPMQELLTAFAAFPHCQLLFTGVNADPGYAAIDRVITQYCTNHPQRAVHLQSLGSRRYLSAMKYCAAVVGNSSSGIIEAPAMKIPTVNMGARQQGRLRSQSVIDCEENASAIQKALDLALTPEFNIMAQQSICPFGDGHTAKKIIHLLKSHPLEGVLMKKFFDVPKPHIANQTINHP